MTEQFISSVEYKVHVQPIAQLYFVTFDRAPEADGLDFWVKAHRAGVSLDVIATEFSQADEFEAKYGQMDDEQFITSLYQNALRREPDEAGQAYWAAQLSGGLSRASVLESFSGSAEMVELRAQEVDFALLYLALTGEPPTMAMIREAVPIRDWLNV
ncbi:DUF4214 domain-containing protein [Orrella daihaiensis]|nr:DUF4214 domain-containing protein [Orrella daihaiensis]